MGSSENRRARRRGRSIAGVGVALATVALALGGCGGRSGPGGSGAMMPLEPADAEFTAIRMLLGNYPKLRFDGEQRTRLEAIQDTLVARNRELAERVRDIMQERRPERPPGRGARGEAPPEEWREQMERAREAVRPLLDEMRENEQEAIERALSVFRGPQREVAEKLIAEYHEQARADRQR